jgi:hypothetical protein
LQRLSQHESRLALPAVLAISFASRLPRHHVQVERRDIVIICTTADVSLDGLAFSRVD